MYIFNLKKGNLLTVMLLHYQACSHMHKQEEEKNLFFLLSDHQWVGGH